MQFARANCLDWRLSLGELRRIVGVAFPGVFILVSVILGATVFPFSRPFSLVELCPCLLFCSLRQYASQIW